MLVHVQTIFGVSNISIQKEQTYAAHQLLPACETFVAQLFVALSPSNQISTSACYIKFGQVCSTLIKTLSLHAKVFSIDNKNIVQQYFSVYD